MASCRRSSEIEGAKNRLSPLGQKSKIPVRRGTRLNNNSGKRSLAKDEVNMKQRILRNRVEKSQNKPPSRIPIAIRRMSCKDVDRSVITTTGKRPLGTESGINLREIRGKQAASINDATDKRATTTEQGIANESTLPATRGTVMKQVTPLETDQVFNVEKNPRKETANVQGDSVTLYKNCEQVFQTAVKSLDESSSGGSLSCEEDHKQELEQLEKEHSEIVEELQQWVEDGDQKNKVLEEIIETTNEENVKLLVQISVMKKKLKALQNENNTLQTKLETKSVDAKNMLESRNEVSTCYDDEAHKKELVQLEKEHSEIEEELRQRWIEDGDKKVNDLEEIIEKTNEENVKLLVQISGMKKVLKALENENNTLQTELKTKRTDVKRLRKNERELRNLKRDLTRKEQSLDNALAEKQELLADIEYLEGSLGDSQAASEHLNAQINELQNMVKKLNKRPDYGHSREETEILKGSLDLFHRKEELLSCQVDALTAEASHLKVCDLDFGKLRDETSGLTDQLEAQKKKNKELNELKDEMSKVIDDLNDQLSTLTIESERIISQKEKELNELNNEKSKFIDQLEDQLAQSESRNVTILSENKKEIKELKKKHSRGEFQLRDQLIMFMKDHARIVSENTKMMHDLGEKWRAIEDLEDQLAKLKKENTKVISDKNKEMRKLNDVKGRVIDQLEEELAKLVRENSSLTTELSKTSYNDKKLTELQGQVKDLKDQKNLILSELDMAYYSLDHNDVVIEKLIKDFEREMFEKDVLRTALEFTLNNCAIKEKAHTRETRNLQYQLQEMRFLLNITDSCSDATESKSQVCECREKFFAM